MLPSKFYQLHFQVRKNISTSKRFQKHLSSGQQTWGGGALISPVGWGRPPGWQGPSTLGTSRLHGWLFRAPILPTSPTAESSGLMPSSEQLIPQKGT